MNARVIKFWNDLQSSYYFIPALMVFGAIALAFLTSHIDKLWRTRVADSLGEFYMTDPDVAWAILTTIAGSMMTVASVTFSITMVAVTSAAGQYGPRLIGNFMRDRANQVTLGTFTSTFVYCLLVLQIAWAGQGDVTATNFVPNVSLLVAVALTLVSVGVMIFFIHHIPETLNVGNLTGKVGRALRDDIEDLFPGRIGTSAPSEEVDTDRFHYKNAAVVSAKAEGYIQAVNEDAILNWAVENRAVVRLQYRPGDFVVTGDGLMHIWPDYEMSADRSPSTGSPNGFDDDALEKLRLGYAMGHDRTAHQNILFLADELVEILARALSPGVNDPFTAINCINWFQSAINAMMAGTPPSPFRRDDAGAVKVISYPVSFDRLVSVLCDQSRAYIAADRNATLKMLTMLTELMVKAKDESHRESLQKQIAKLEAVAMETASNTPEKQDMRRAFEKSTRMIQDPDYYADVLSSQTWGGGRS